MLCVLNAVVTALATPTGRGDCARVFAAHDARTSIFAVLDCFHSFGGE